MLKEKNIGLKVSDTSFKFVCDPFELERVIVNLLTNAIKYTQNGNNIEIKAVKNEAPNIRDPTSLLEVTLKLIFKLFN